MLRQTWLVTASALVLILVAGRSAPAADGVDELLPAGTQQFLVVQVKSFLASDAYKKYADELVKGALAQGEAKDFQTKLGIDPLKDIERVVMASPAVDPANPTNASGAVVLVGNFDAKKINAAAAEFVTKYKENVAIVRDGPHTLIKLSGETGGQKQNMYAAVVDSKRVLIGTKQEDVRAALDRVAGKMPAVVKDKALLKALNSLDPAVQFAGRIAGSVLQFLPGLDDPASAKLIEKVNFAALEVRVTSDIKVGLILEMADADAAKEMQPKIAAFAEQAKLMAKVVSANVPPLKVLDDVGKTLMVNTKGKSIILQGDISADVLEALAKLAKM